jgi:hypothetical protein
MSLINWDCDWRMESRDSGCLSQVVTVIVIVMLIASPSGAEDFSVSELQRISKSRTELESGDKSNYVKPQWAPSGRMLSFETYAAQQRLLYVSELGSKPASELKSAAFTGGSRFRESSSSTRARANFDLAWSRGGDYEMVIFVGSGDQGYFGLYGIEIGKWGSFESIVGGNEEDPFVGYPNYHPNEAYLVYCQGVEQKETGGGRLELNVALDLESQKGYKLIARQEIPQIDPSFSPDGREIAFTGIDQGNNDIYKITNLQIDILPSGSLRVKDGAVMQRLTTMPNPEAKARWSPDGSMIAFISGRPENIREWDLWVMDADGGNPRKLVDRVLERDFPEWHMDGEHIFFVRLWEEEQNPIQYVNVNTGHLGTLLTGTVLHTHIDISDDGQKIAFSSQGEPRNKDSNLNWLKMYIADLQIR